jgi:hypothetical protein
MCCHLSGDSARRSAAVSRPRHSSSFRTCWIMRVFHVRVEDLLLGGDPPRIHITHAKPIVTYQSSRRWRTNCAHTSRDGRKDSFSRAIGTPAIHPGWSNPIVKDCARPGIAKRVYPICCGIPSPRSCWTPDKFPSTRSKFLGHLNLSTTQIYPKPASKRWATTIFAPWAAITAPGSMPDRRYFAVISTFARLRPIAL